MRIPATSSTCIQLAIIVLMAAPGWAQEAPPETQPPAAEPDEQKAPAETAAEADPVAPEIAIGGLEGYGLTDSKVPPGGRMAWAERRKIRVIQKREMLKDARHAFGVTTGIIPNDDFFAYLAVGLTYSHYFSEDFAVDFIGAYAIDQKTSLEDSLTKARPFGPGLIVRLPQTLESYAAVALSWNLLHGKLTFFQTGLTEFDFGLVFGIGANSTKIQGKGAQQKARRIDANGNVGATGLFYISNNWALRLDYRQFFFPKEGGGVSFPIATMVGVSYFTAAPE